MIILSKVNLKCHSFLRCRMFQALRLVSDDTTIYKLDNITIFKEFGFCEDYIVKLSNKQSFKKCPPIELKKVLNKLKDFGFSKEDVLFHPQILSLRAPLIDHRFNILKEGGVPINKITLHLISKYSTLFKASASTLKKQGIIKENIDITRNILSFCDLPINLYPAATDDSQPFTVIQINTVKHYLRWLLDISEEELNHKFKIYTVYNNRSVWNIQQVFNILHNNFEFPKEKIRRHMYLLQITPDLLLDNMKHVPFIASKPLKDVGYLFPKLLMRPTEIILEILQILKDFNIDEKNAAQFPEMFSMSPKTVRERVQLLSTDPQYKNLIYNARLFQNVTNFQRLTKRSHLIKESKWHCYSTDILVVGQQQFDIRFKMRPDYYNGSDILHFLKKKLNMPTEKIRNLISKHVLWNYVALNSISSTLEFLREAGFSNTEIKSALTVILYPKCEVEKCIKGLNENPEVDCCRDPSTGKVRPELVLQLVLYFLERPFHFTGNGVWELDPTHTEQPQSIQKRSNHTEAHREQDEL